MTDNIVNTSEVGVIVDLSTPQKRLKQFIESKFKTKKEFADAIGIRQDVLYRYITGSSVFGKLYLGKVRQLGLNTEWYIHGTGEMNTAHSSSVYSDKPIPYYSLTATASYLQSFNDIQEVPEFFIYCPPLADCSAFITVHGDSMYPMFSSGDMVALKKLNDLNHILWGEPHLVVTDSEANDMRTIKLVFPCEESQDSVILRASNPRYAGDVLVKKENILKMFIIKGTLSLRQM